MSRASRPSHSLAGLQKSRKWAEFVHQHALSHGWEAFPIETVHQGKTHVIEMPASELRNGVYIYTGSYNKRLEAGIPLSMRDAMSLALHYKKTQPEMYLLWESQNL
jgi:ribosomal protein L13E